MEAQLVARSTKHISFSVLFFALLMYTAIASAALDGPKLGLGFKQGYDYPYIFDIDPHGLGASVGFMPGDHIKQIGHSSIWFIGQAEQFFQYMLTKNEPFTVMVKRNGALLQILVDKKKKPRVFPQKKGLDAFSGCFFAPNLTCLEDATEAMRPVGNSNSFLIRYYSLKIKSFVLLNKKQKALANLKAMESLFFNDPKLVEYNSWTVLESRSLLELKPEKRHLDYIYKHTRKSLVAISRKASMFAEFGQADFADVFYDDIINLNKKRPAELKNNTMYVARVLAKLNKKEQLLAYLKTDKYSSHIRNRLLERYIVELVKEQKQEQMKDAISMIFSVKRPWTNKDYLLFAKLFHKLHMNEAARSMIKRLEKNYENARDNVFIQVVLARSLIEANAALGRIHLARKYIDKHFKDRTLELLMTLVLEATKSRSSQALAVQYYKDLPKLIDETYALLKETSSEQRKKLNKRVVIDFYEVLAAYLPAKPKFSELTGYTKYEGDFSSVISSFIEARRFDEAMAWARAFEKQFGKANMYGDIYRALGALSPSREFSAKFKTYAPFKSNKIHYYRPHIERLYWNGYFDEALEKFHTLTIDQKISLTLDQARFVLVCKACSL